MQHTIFALEVCARLEPGSTMRSRLADLLKGHPVRANLSHKHYFYNMVCRELLSGFASVEKGCWDYFDDDERARKDFEMWSQGMITEEGARTAPSGTPAGEDPYRGSSEPRYLTFTMAFLMKEGTITDLHMRNRCNVPQPQLWKRDTFMRLLQGVMNLSFVSVRGDVAYLIPGDPSWALTPQDLTHPKFHYLRPVE